MKRRATQQITKDNPEAVEGAETESGPAKASPETLKGRQIIRVKRKDEAHEEPKPVALPGFSLVAPPAPASDAPKSEAASSVSLGSGGLLQKKLAPGWWTCTVCEVANRPDAVKCAACEAPKPGSDGAASASAPASASASAAAAGATAPASSSSSSASNAVDFFAPISSSSSASTASSSSSSSFWNFGSTESSAAATWNFGGATAPWDFGGSSASSSSGSATTGATADADATAAAGSTLAGAEFAPKAAGGGDGSGFGGTDAGQHTYSFGSVEGGGFGKGELQVSPEDGGADAAKVGAAQVNPEFATEKAQTTGEEKEKVLKSIRCKLFALRQKEGDAETSDWSERGVGELHVNTGTDEQGVKYSRLVMRADKTRIVILNAPLFVGLNAALQGEHFVRFMSLDTTSKNEPKGVFFLLKFKSRVEASDALRAIEEAVQYLK